MQSALAVSALLMGLAGGPHCVAMCGAACGAVLRMARPESEPVTEVIHFVRPRTVGAASTASAAWALHGGRVAGYALAGAVSAATVQLLGNASIHIAALRPLWLLLHVVVLCWGLVLAATGRQPLWSQRVGRQLAQRLRLQHASNTGIFVIGGLWTTMPCGLLYSALMLAGLANGPVQGAFVMALFALGSGVSLWAAPWLWARLRWRKGGHKSGQGANWGTRVAGVLLALVSAQALGLDLQHQIALWCA